MALKSDGSVLAWGMNDLGEYELAALGSDWRTGGTAQETLVNTYYAAANTNSLYDQAQVQALHIDVPLIQRDNLTGEVTLTLGLGKATDLTNFDPFPFNTPGSSVFINGAGKIEFKFTPLDNAAFFLLETD